MNNQIITPATNDQQKLLDEINTLKSRHTSDLQLSLERIKMLEAVINDVSHALNVCEQYLPKGMLNPVNTRLGIGQLLADDFIENLNSDIEALGE